MGGVKIFMKKISLSLFILGVIFLGVCSKINAQNSFPQSLKTCETYEQAGVIEHNKDYFSVQINLDKKGEKCVYKEKIYQGKDYQMLTCNFDKSHLPFLSDSMQRFNDAFKKEIAKNKIFEAKMTTNGEIFQKYLIDKSICQITHSSKKK